MTHQQALFEYALRLGDNALILGQRLSEWCGHGPVLEQDIALTNIALDQVGQARSWLTYAGEIEGKGRSEDDLAYHREQREFRNVLLVEQPNQDWAYTMIRQFLFDAFNFYLHEQLTGSRDQTIAAIAAKSLKEITYHLRYSSEWVIRLGDGTDLSHRKMQTALDDLWIYSGELTQVTPLDAFMAEEELGADLDRLRPRYEEKVREVLEEATLSAPNQPYHQQGGKEGRHSEHLGHILAAMQSVQRAYPGQKW